MSHQQDSAKPDSDCIDELDSRLTFNPSGLIDTIPATDKALPVITKDEVGRIVDLGLGRGVDATDPSPWLNKSSFQVRRVTIDNILGTEEGGSMQSYEREVSSVTTQQTDLKASVAIPQAPVNLGLEGEQSRSVSTTRKAIGKRVMNRTISFASQFDDLSQSNSKSNVSAMKDSVAAQSIYAKEQIIDQAQHVFTFEELLSKWILGRILHRYQLEKSNEDLETPPEIAAIKGVNPREDISHYIHAVHRDRDKTQQILNDCAHFVQHFRITHYVNSISLGAAQYRLLSETEYFNKVSAKGTFGFEAIANLAVMESFSKKKIHRTSNVRKIGRITEEKVPRGSYDEAVIGIGILPIHQLVQLRCLHLGLRKALLEYIDVKGDTSCGPFVIVCGDSKIYWTVNEGNGFAIEGTTEASQASLFSIIPSDDGDYPYEFLIGWQKYNKRVLPHSESTMFQSEENKGARMCRYLNAHVSVLGRNNGPLHLRNDIQQEDARFALHGRVLKKHISPVDLREWILGKDQFFINCSRRKRRKDGYLAMKRVPQRKGQNEFTSVCVPSPQYHNEKDTFMLFSLASPKTKEDVRKRQELELDSELDQFIDVPSPASSAFNHTASAVTSVVGRTDNSTPVPKQKEKNSLEMNGAFDIEETVDV